MPPKSDMSWLDAAFPKVSQKALNASIRKALASNPAQTPLFKDISAYILTLTDATAAAEPATKKRKITPSNAVPGTALLKIRDLGFTIPQRKKFTLVISGTRISAANASGAEEFGVDIDDVQYVACLPVPDKPARQWNFVVFPEGAEGLGSEKEKGAKEAIVFTVPDGEAKGAEGEGVEGKSARELVKETLDALLGKSECKARQVVEPDEKVFHSAIPQSHRKGEKAFHVKAHRGSKEGYLFFLRDGIIWAFKKPLCFFSFGTIDAISYTSITKRTFNLSISLPSDTEIEFSMIDQDEYPSIDEYLKLNRLQDASLAAARKAKYFRVNGKKGEDGAAEEEEEGPSELAKALEDAEDEEEEDYVPGKEKEERESTVEDSEEDSDEDGDREMDSDEEGSVDLQDELGSEMEDVQPEAPRAKRRRNGVK